MDVLSPSTCGEAFPWAWRCRGGPQGLPCQPDEGGGGISSIINEPLPRSSHSRAVFCYAPGRGGGGCSLESFALTHLCSSPPSCFPPGPPHRRCLCHVPPVALLPPPRLCHLPLLFCTLDPAAVSCCRMKRNSSFFPKKNNWSFCSGWKRGLAAPPRMGTAREHPGCAVTFPCVSPGGVGGSGPAGVWVGTPRLPRVSAPPGSTPGLPQFPRHLHPDPGPLAQSSDLIRVGAPVPMGGWDRLGASVLVLGGV